MLPWPTTGMGTSTESEELTNYWLISARPLEGQSRNANHRTEYGRFVNCEISKFSHLVCFYSRATLYQSGKKLWGHLSLFLIFYNLIHQTILLALSLKYVQNLTIPHHFYYFYLVQAIIIFQVLLQLPSNWSPWVSYSIISTWQPERSFKKLSHHFSS